MADQAFALSPISASASLPTQADYDAISGAFMETARGRWFLAEYARRNRNADTSTVLEAVARIERTLAEQKQQHAPGNEPDLLPVVTAILTATRASVEAALTGLKMEDALAPARKSARVIGEIAWGLRESGADGSICGLLDAQVDAINAACDGFSTEDLRDGVLGALDREAKQISDLGKQEGQPAPRQQPQTFEKPKIVPTKAETTVVRLEQPQTITPSVAALAAAAPPADEASMFANISGSLGATLLVSGVVAKPPTPKSDPLAPIRRMSAAEKIAFFS